MSSFLIALRMAVCSALLLFFTISISEAQTKQETIEWLESKLSLPANAENYDGSGRLIWDKRYQEALNDCKFKICFEYPRGGGRFIKLVATIPLKNIHLDERKYITIDYNGVDIDRFFSSSLAFEPDTYSSTSVSNSLPFRIIDKEPNLAERVFKALNHLATFCKEISPEKF
ncbi:hypothetical protein [Dyadobacter sp. CY323]|uniref:hypothetical protein n=1 Tax=Dyadobacter sp. CY323 TaxID=2907302 RepID=UPI001F2B734F|nr:hypothetical protein [Dyadobacter sp. CY323]MCE6993181.1 hypothetical protein [Dyadobacter sp. CY323]